MPGAGCRRDTDTRRRRGGSPPAAGSPGGASPELTAATTELQAALTRCAAPSSGRLRALGQALAALDTAVKKLPDGQRADPGTGSGAAPAPGPGG